jgi:hypothetical protein
MDSRRFNWNLLYVICLFILLTPACSGKDSPGGRYVWIDVPVQGLTVPLGGTINIEGHAADPGGVSYVEIWINDVLTWTIEELPPAGNLYRFAQQWIPTEGGDYIIHAVAYSNSGGKSNPATVLVHVREEAAVAVQVEDSSPEGEESPTPEEEPEEGPQEVEVKFWADPPQIDAGSCTTLYWKVENALKVFLGKSVVSPQGQYQACHCSSTSYTLTVTKPEGAEENFTLPVQVSGKCPAPTTEEEDTPTPKPTKEPSPTPTVEKDQNPPPAPVQLKPLDGSDLDCVLDTILRWQAVSDPSGISEYQVQAQYLGGGSIWLGVSGSPWTGISDTNLKFNLDCSRTYRWRVRAVDGAGNPGPWSGWFTFETVVS